MMQKAGPSSGHAFTERVQPRHGVAVRALLRLDGGHDVRMRLRDVSEAGFSGHAIEAVAPGSLVIVHLPDLEPVTAEILWQVGPAMGGRFAKPLSPEQMQALREASRRDAAPERASG